MTTEGLTPMTPDAPARRRFERRGRGQASTEYILLIGLIVFALIVALLFYRDATGRFIDRVADWIDGTGDSSTPTPKPKPPAAAPPPATTPSEKPAPPPTESAAEPPLDWLVGPWCHKYVQWIFRDTPEGKIVEIRPDPSNYTCPIPRGSYRIEATGPGTARIVDSEGRTLATVLLDPEDANQIQIQCPLDPHQRTTEMWRCGPAA